MSTLKSNTSIPALAAKSSSGYKDKKQQGEIQKQYFDEQSLERSLEHILNQHNAVFEALKNR